MQGEGDRKTKETRESDGEERENMNTYMLVIKEQN